MATVPTQIRIDEGVKSEATSLFKNLGLDMSSAVNMFLRQCVLQEKIPFSIEMPRYNKKVLRAMDEAKAIAEDPNVKGYDSIEELNAALEED